MLLNMFHQPFHVPTHPNQNLHIFIWVTPYVFDGWAATKRALPVNCINNASNSRYGRWFPAVIRLKTACLHLHSSKLTWTVHELAGGVICFAVSKGAQSLCIEPDCFQALRTKHQGFVLESCLKVWTTGRTDGEQLLDRSRVAKERPDLRQNWPWTNL